MNQEPTIPKEENLPEQAERPSPLQRREQAVQDALRALVRDYVIDQVGAKALDGRTLELNLRLRAQVNPEQAWDLRFEPSLQEQLAGQCADATAEWGTFQAGHVFCFRCRSASCEHAVPVSPLHVFSGYAANGVPKWHELSQAFIDARDDRVDQLHEAPPRVAARAVRGRDLKQEQLSSFGRTSKTYSLLGQVIAGYFLLDCAVRSRTHTPQRLAVSYQAVETRDPDGQFALRLNPVAAIPGGATIEELFASDWEPWVGRAQHQAATDLARIEKQVRAAKSKGDNSGIDVALRKVPGLLRRFANSLERGHRQSRRRTHHVEERRGQKRPVHMAMSDTRRAAPETILCDVKTDTLVICGPQSRVHVFTRGGRHVTSFVGAPNIVAFRRRTHRWRDTDRQEREAFLEEFRSG